jgi:hypothetical protein
MPDTSEIRPFPFSDPNLQAAIDRAILKADADHHVVVVAVADGTSARLAIAYKGQKFGGQYSFGGFLDKPYSGNMTYGVEFRFSA